MALDHETTPNATELERLYKRVNVQIGWYRRDRNINRTFYYGFLILSIVCAFSASTIAALGDSNDKWVKSALVILPLVATFCASLIQQFNWHAVYELREQGRIDTLELLFLVQRSRPRTADALAKLEETVYGKLIELSRRQARGFFDSSKGRDKLEPRRDANA